ncbi:hypothetical protein [Ponticoccus litoralis]|uniref:Uncharacterized protein n=1 Tax=Ponticoccus litoralis TaxID=422297 RepID=A0AAW9SN48_9RHOB
MTNDAATGMTTHQGMSTQDRATGAALQDGATGKSTHDRAKGARRAERGCRPARPAAVGITP